jgi:hypothetical protein
MDFVQSPVTGETPVLHSLFKDAGKGAGVPTLKFLNVNLQDIAKRIL